MPLSPIVVAIAPADAAPDLRQALLDACTRAAEEAPCVEAASGAAPGAANAPRSMASVSWPDASHARVEVSFGADAAPVVRTIAFGAGDAEAERWRAVGLVVGTLASTAARIIEEKAEVLAADEPIERPPAPVLTLAPPLTDANAPLGEAKAVPLREPQEDAPAPPSRGVEPRAWRGSIEIASLLGSALDRGAPRIGAELGGRVELPAELLQLAVGVSYSEGASREGGVRSRFVEATIGGGFSQPIGGGFSGGARVEGLCQRFDASLPGADPGSGEVASRGRFLGGVRVGADVHYWALDRLGPFVEAAGQWVGGSTNVNADGVRVGGVPTVGYVVGVGAAYRLR